jgi:Ricin-type beta-trefoil lectin domain
MHHGLRILPILRILPTVGLLAAACTISAIAGEPVLKAPAPFIYLADNLDEKDKLGWCIDTVGRGFSEQLQAHSCKPQGGDVQFIFKQATGHIASVEFNNKCMTLSAPENKNIPFGLLDCSANESQKFTYDTVKMQFHPANNLSLCVAVAPTSRTAGPFMSRDLTLSPCAETDKVLMTWLMKLK